MFFRLSIFCLLFLPNFSFATELAFSEDLIVTTVDQKLEAHVIISSEESFNAIEAQVHFDTSMLRLDSVSAPGSIISYWIESPKEIGAGTIKFSGIIPGGISGNDLKLVKLIFTPIKAGSSYFGFTGSSVLKHDGLGTPLALSVRSLNVESSATDARSDLNETRDTIPPAPFIPTIYRDANGNEVLIFHTTDKESGIEKYYVKEAKYSFLLPFAEWQESEGIYVLKYLSESTNLRIKAVDKENNERTVRFPADGRKSSWYWIIIIILPVLIFLRRQFLRGKLEIDS